MASRRAFQSRSRRRLLTSCGAVGVVALALAGCGSNSSSGTAGGSGSTFKVGYSAPFLSAQFEVTLQQQMISASKGTNLDFLAPTNADSDSGQQITDVANLISAGAKGLIVVANDSKAIIPALDQAQSAHVPVVSIDIGPDGGHVAAIVRADNVGMGQIACQDMAKAIGEKGKVLSLMGAQTSINGRERSQGFRDCIKQNYPNITLIERPTDWDPTKQADALQTVLAANPDLKGIFQQSDYALSPTLNVLKTAGRDAKVGESGHIYDISIDGTPQGLDLVKSGVMDAEISQPLDGYVKYGLQYLQEALAGKTISPGPTDHDSKIVMFNGNPMDLLPATLVTKKNVDDPDLWGNKATG